MAAFLGYRLARKTLPLLRQLASHRRANSRRRTRITVAFYRQFESALARIGLQRTVAQTQRQFAHVAAQHLAASPQLAAAADIPHQIVDAFYQVRFGQWTPDAQQEAEQVGAKPGFGKRAVMTDLARERIRSAIGLG